MQGTSGTADKFWAQASQDGTGGAGIAVQNPYLEKMCANLCQGWIPCDTNWLKGILSKIKQNQYETTAQLVDDLKKDISLFMYCVRELSGVVHSCQTSNSPEPQDPVKMLKSAQLAQLTSVLAVNEAVISTHSLKNAEKTQEGVLLESSLSATAVEILSSEWKLDSEAAFSCALFRQLGLILIAWNYPHVYARVVSNLSASESLDSAIGKVLGVTPSMLALKLARTWKVSSQLLRGMGDSFVPLCPDSVGVGEKLQKVCDIGEALARASNPEHFPTASKDWAFVKREVESVLGEDAFNLVLEKIDSACCLYRRHNPQLFTQVPHEVEAELKEGFGEKSFKKNPYIKKCPDFLVEKLREIYAQLNGVSINSDVIRRLVTGCVTSVGFVRGCVYLIEPDVGVLAPRLSIGDAAHCYVRMMPYVYSSHLEGNSIVQAFNSGSILVSGSAVLQLVGAIGTLQKVGVLYLEIPKTNLEIRQDSILDCYCAINTALGDCLNVS